MYLSEKETNVSRTYIDEFSDHGCVNVVQTYENTMEFVNPIYWALQRQSQLDDQSGPSDCDLSEQFCIASCNCERITRTKI